MSTLQPGDKAPEFTANTQDGKSLSLSDFRGKKVVLYFYPKDDTSGCTAQACAYRDAQPDFAAKGAIILGVSVDPVKSHAKFAKKYELSFPLIADEDKSIVQAYGVWVEKSMYGRKYMGAERSTFVIDEEGVITHIWRKVKPAEDAGNVLKAL
ncbi:thioredoxin-dependent thiol peroxidase [Verrucomicrobia bacterium LW23]|nr:thioredoxin-dependent thiol peroxidase [Verrucomicrobia bacterium LW23]